MPGAGVGAIKAGDAYVEIGVDAKAVTTGLASVRKKMKAFGADMRKLGIGLTAAGMAILAPLALAARQFSSYGDQVAKMARKTGLSAEAISELSYAAEISGTNIEGLEKSLRRMARTISDARDGMTEYLRAFDKIGVGIEEFEGLSPEQAFLRIGQALEAIEDPMVRAAAAQEIFGRSGTALIPMFDQGAGALEKMRAESHRLGVVLSHELAVKAEQLTDAMTDVRTSLKGVTITIGAVLAPRITGLAAGITNVLSRITGWLKANSALSETILTLTTGMGGLLVALGALAIAIWGVTTALTILAGHPIVAVVAGFTLVGIAALGASAAIDSFEKSTIDALNASREFETEQYRLKQSLIEGTPEYEKQAAAVKALAKAQVESIEDVMKAQGKEAFELPPGYMLARPPTLAMAALEDQRERLQRELRELWSKRMTVPDLNLEKNLLQMKDLIEQLKTTEDHLTAVGKLAEAAGIELGKALEVPISEEIGTVMSKQIGAVISRNLLMPAGGMTTRFAADPALREAEMQNVWLERIHGEIRAGGGLG